MTDSLAYQKGYAAGKRRVDRELREEAQQQQRQALLDQVFLAVLPYFMEHGGGWHVDGGVADSMDARVELAWRAVAKSLAKRRLA